MQVVDGVRTWQRASAVGQHAAHRLVVGRVQIHRAAQVTLALGRLLGQDVAFERLSTLDRAAGPNFEPLRSALLGLHLRHFLPSLFVYAAGRPAIAGSSKACSTWYCAFRPPLPGKRDPQIGAFLLNPATSSCAATAPSPSAGPPGGAWPRPGSAPPGPP